MCACVNVLISGVHVLMSSSGVRMCVCVLMSSYLVCACVDVLISDEGFGILVMCGEKGLHFKQLQWCEINLWMYSSLSHLT